MILSTCNRVEIYAATQLEPAQAFAALQEFLVTRHDYRDPLTDEIYTLSEPQSLHHLFKVACGLDSMVLGETEILGQLKKAYDLALQNGHTGSRLNKAFQRAFNVAKHIRTETNIQRGSVSVGSVAVELAEKIFSSLTDRDVMVIGAGDTSEKTARALLSRGARSIIVANRSHDSAVALAKELGGRAVPFDDWAGEFENMDIVISSTSAPHYILDRARLEPLMKLRRNRPLLLIDIAVPRDIDPEVNFLENVYLYNMDDLQAMVLGGDGNIGSSEGVLLFAILICYIVWAVYQSRRETSEVRRQFEQEYPIPARGSRRQVGRQIGLVLVGLVLLTLGARWLVDGATTIARLLGMSELLIGLTIVALGTSLPEVAASVLASWRGERDIAVGNVIGSNLFNILCVLGLSAAVSAQGVAVPASALRFDIPVMIAVAVVCLPIFFTGQQIARWEGGLFLGYYVAYTLYLVLSETQPNMSRTFGTVMWAVVIPLTAVTLLLSLRGTLRSRRP